jgi:hypothetical protein
MASETFPARGNSTFVVALIFLALAGLALSPLMMSIRGSLWLGPQTLAFGVAGVTIAALVAYLAYRHVSAEFLDSAVTAPWFVGAVIVAAPLFSLAVIRLDFHAFANSGDEYAFLFQAETLLHGRLANPPPPDPVLFGQSYLFTALHGWVGQYLPGWPALIAMVEALSLPGWFATPLTSLGLLALLWGALKRECPSPALAAALLAAYAGSGFFILNGATFYSHCAAAAGVVGTVHCLLRWEQGNADRWPILAGACAGLALLCRLDSFLLAALAAGAAWIEHKGRVRLLALGLIGFAPMAALFALYNFYITGSPILLPTIWAGYLHFGAGGLTGVEDWSGRSRILVQTGWRIGELADTASLLLPALYGVSLFLALRKRDVRFYDLLPLANLILFAIFPDLGGFQIGPRYWFDGFAVMHLTVGRALAVEGVGWRRFATAACLLLSAFSLARLPAQIDYFGRIAHERESVFRLAAQLPQDRLHIVLVQSFKSAWNERFAKSQVNFAMDFARNGTEFEGPVLFGRGDLPDSLARACRLFPGADVEFFSLDRQHPDGRLTPAACE